MLRNRKKKRKLRRKRPLLMLNLMKKLRRQKLRPRKKWPMPRQQHKNKLMQPMLK